MQPRHPPQKKRLDFTVVFCFCNLVFRFIFLRNGKTMPVWSVWVFKITYMTLLSRSKHFQLKDMFAWAYKCTTLSMINA